MRSSESIDEIKQITSTPKKLKASVDENGNLNEPKGMKCCSLFSFFYFHEPKS